MCSVWSVAAMQTDELKLKRQQLFHMKRTWAATVRNCIHHSLGWTLWMLTVIFISVTSPFCLLCI